jgi:DNA-directed RNA polymerase specialized sigma24 family protein
LYRSFAKKCAGRKFRTSLAEKENIHDGRENSLDRLAYKDIIETIRSLSLQYRAIFNMHVIEGMKHEEIARSRGISVGASKSSLSKARDHLKKNAAKKNSVRTSDNLR